MALSMSVLVFLLGSRAHSTPGPQPWAFGHTEDTGKGLAVLLQAAFALHTRRVVWGVHALGRECGSLHCPPPQLFHRSVCPFHHAGQLAKCALCEWATRPAVTSKPAMGEMQPHHLTDHTTPDRGVHVKASIENHSNSHTVHQPSPSGLEAPGLEFLSPI